MLRIARSRRGATLAALAAAVSLWLPQAAAQGQITPQASRPAPAAGLAGINLNSAPWLRQVLGRTPVRRGAVHTKVTIGNFSDCPALPSGDVPAQFSCFLIHITGGQMIIGNANQVINRDVTIAYAEGTDPAGNTVIVWGSMHGQPMPVLGGIFLSPLLQNATQGDPNLELGVQTQGVGMTPDLNGGGEGFVSMLIRSVNPVFGSHCLIGTAKHPVTLDPTFGPTNPPPPNQSISGNVASAGFNGVELIIIGTLVDNAFAVPAAHGCGPHGALNRLVNVAGGFPSPAGTNTAIFQVTVEAVGYPTVNSS